MSDADALRRLAAQSPSERRAAVEALYEPEWERTIKIARDELRRRGTPNALGPDLFAQEAWVKLGAYVRDEPVLNLGAFLRTTIQNLIIDAYRRERGGKNLLERLQGIRDKHCDTDLERTVVEYMMELELDGTPWDDVAAVVRRSGEAEDVVTEIVERVRSRLNRREPSSEPPPDGPETERLRGALVERIKTIFPPGTKKHAVANAIAKMLKEEGGVHGTSLDHKALRRHLEQPWRSSENALHQMTSRVTRELRADPECRAIWACLTRAQVRDYEEARLAAEEYTAALREEEDGS